MRLAGIGTFVQTQHDDFEDAVDRGPIDLVHDQELWITETRLSVDAALHRRLSLSLLLPIRVVSTSIRYLDLAGDEVRLVTEGIHHRNETVSGIVDPMLLAATTFVAGGFRITGRAGLSVPLGRTEENPFTAEAEVTAHQHIQLGTGTFNPVLAAELSRGFGEWRVGAFALTQQVLYANGKGYHAGDRYAVGVQVLRRLGDRWSVRGGGEVQAETAERWDGLVPVDDGNRGRLDLMLVGGASVRATDRLSVDLALKLPLVTHAENGQLDMPLIGELGVSWSFGAQAAPVAKAEDAHRHEHGDEHGHDDGDAHAPGDTTGLDVVDLGPPGDAVPLTPVPGKITIFDFWATWCQPCKTLEPALIAIARKHPDKVAIRRIDVVHWDSAAAATYLTPRGFDLPHLEIYGPTGKKILQKGTKGSSLDALIDEVEALVEATVGR